MFEIGGSPLRMRASRRRGAGVSEYHACVRILGAGAPAVRAWGLHACAPGEAASEACIDAISDTSCCRGAYMDVRSHRTSRREARRGLGAAGLQFTGCMQEC